MRRYLRRCLLSVCACAFLLGGVAAASAARFPSADPASAGEMYILRGPVVQFIPSAGGSVGSVSIRVQHANRGESSLRGLLLTVAVDRSTHVVGSIRVGADCAIRLRAKNTAGLGGSTALEVVADARAAVSKKSASPSKGKKPPAKDHASDGSNASNGKSGHGNHDSSSNKPSNDDGGKPATVPAPSHDSSGGNGHH